MIILEGAEGVGKSTFAEKLAENLDFTIHKFTQIPKSRDEFWEQVSICKDLTSKKVIQDRCPLVSDYIYAQHNETRNPFVEKEDVLHYLSNMNVLLIYVDADRRNPTKSKLDIWTQEEIYKKYTHLFIDIVNTNIPCMYYNYFSTHHKAFLDNLRKIFECKGVIK